MRRVRRDAHLPDGIAVSQFTITVMGMLVGVLDGVEQETSARRGSRRRSSCLPHVARKRRREERNGLARRSEHPLAPNSTDMTRRSVERYNSSARPAPCGPAPPPRRASVYCPGREILRIDFQRADSSDV